MLYLCTAVLSFIWAYLLVPSGNFPYFGLTFLLSSYALIVFFSSKIHRRLTWIVFVFTLLFAFCITFKSNGLLTFFNIVLTLYFGSLLVFLSKSRQPQLNFISYVFLPLWVIGQVIKTSNTYIFQWERLMPKKIVEKKHIKELVVSVFIGVVVIAVVLPLLASANPIFSQLVENITKFANINLLLERIFGDTAALFIYRVLMTFIFYHFILKTVTLLRVDESSPTHITRFNFQVPLLIAKVILGFVLLVFFIAQIQLYTASTETLTSFGLTHSEHTREVFFQLSVVAGIVFFLIYNDRTRNKFSKILTYVLVIEGVFLTFVAFKSVYDYSFNFGFTIKRLYGFATITWLIGILTLFTYSYIKKINETAFLLWTVLFTGFIFININLLNFDYLIAHNGRARTGESVDYFYLSTLSPDSYSYHTLLAELLPLLPRNDIFGIFAETYNVANKIQYLQDKYKNISIATFNYAEYLQFQQVKDIKVEEIYLMVETTENITPEFHEEIKLERRRIN